MFNRHAADQRIIWMAPAPLTTWDSISADLDYLHHVRDEQRKGYANGEQTLRIHYSGPTGFRGYMFRRLNLRP
jgi:hypothetical protein